MPRILSKSGPIVSQLNQPAGVAFNAAGNLYISDSLNARIPKVGLNGIITTVAGTTPVPRRLSRFHLWRSCESGSVRPHSGSHYLCGPNRTAKYHSLPDDRSGGNGFAGGLPRRAAELDCVAVSHGVTGVVHAGRRAGGGVESGFHVEFREESGAEGLCGSALWDGRRGVGFGSPGWLGTGVGGWRYTSECADSGDGPFGKCSHCRGGCRRVEPRVGYDRREIRACASNRMLRLRLARKRAASRGVARSVGRGNDGPGY